MGKGVSDTNMTWWRRNQTAAAAVEEVQEDWKETLEEPVVRHPLLTVQSVERTFQVGGQPLHVLKGINMELRPRQLVMLRGRSGSGKTTLLNHDRRSRSANEGAYLFSGFAIPSMSDDERTKVRRKQMGFIFQAFALMPLLSAYENVELSLRMAGIPGREWKSRVEHCLDLVGLPNGCIIVPSSCPAASSSVSPSPKRLPTAESASRG